jgi:hypothetical protein
MHIKNLFYTALLVSGCFTSLLFISWTKTKDEIKVKKLFKQQVTGKADFIVGANEHYVNVMGNAMPKIPTIPAVAVKKGTLRGYVVDLNGKPIKGATIGARATMVGGYYSGAKTQTNEKGYYEILLPKGAVTIYTAATTIDYGQGKAVVGLYPTDKDANTFASANGKVKNFVLLSYGLGNPTNYYGGSLLFNFHLYYKGENPIPGYLPEGGQIEIELKPDGPGFYGESKSFKIVKTIGNNLNFSVVNIPLGKYIISAKMKNGKALNLKANGRYLNVFPFFGMKPDDTVGTSTVMFTPQFKVTPEMVPLYRSNWNGLEIGLSL